MLADAPKGPVELLGGVLFLLPIADHNVRTLAAETRRHALETSLLAFKSKR